MGWLEGIRVDAKKLYKMNLAATGIHDFTRGLPNTRKEPNMNAIQKLMAEKYPNTEDYLLVEKHVQNWAESGIFRELYHNPETFLDEIKAYNEWVKENEDE